MVHDQKWVVGLLEPLIYHGFCDLERPSRVAEPQPLAQLLSTIARKKAA